MQDDEAEDRFDRQQGHKSKSAEAEDRFHRQILSNQAGKEIGLNDEVLMSKLELDDKDELEFTQILKNHKLAEVRKLNAEAELIEAQARHQRAVAELNEVQAQGQRQVLSLQQVQIAQQIAAVEAGTKPAN